MRDGLPLPTRYGAILAIALGITVSVIDSAIANVALPTIARDLNTAPANSIWVINAYQLAIIMSLLSLSSLGDLLGYKRIYLTGLALFTLTSLFCALASSLPTLILARVAQGFGAAAIMSVNTALIRLVYPKAYLGRGLAINALIVALAAAAGPTVAAAILSLASWPWLFAVNVPIGLCALLLGRRFLPENPVKAKESQHFDWISAVMNAVTFGLLISLIGSGTLRENTWLLVAQGGLLLMVGYIFIRRQLSQAYPLLPVDLLRIPIFSLSILTSICSFTAQMLAIVSMPFYLQNILGRSEVATGLLLTPWPLAIMVTAPLAGRLIGRIHAGILGAIGLILLALGLLGLALLPAAPSNLDIIWRMILCGIGFGLFQPPNNHTMISSAPPERSGGASGMLGTARLLGQTTGAALVAVMFTLFDHQAMHAALFLGAGLSVLAALLSLSRTRAYVV